MMVEYLGSQFDVPDVIIDKYVKDFEGLPGSGLHENVVELRESVADVLDIAAEVPDILEEKEYRVEFVKALAMKKALEKHGLMYDA